MSDALPYKVVKRRRVERVYVEFPADDRATKRHLLFESEFSGDEWRTVRSGPKQIDCMTYDTDVCEFIFEREVEDQRHLVVTAARMLMRRTGTGYSLREWMRMIEEQAQKEAPDA